MRLASGISAAMCVLALATCSRRDQKAALPKATADSLAAALRWPQATQQDSAAPQQPVAHTHCVPTSEPWYRRSRVLDATGDGTPDSLTLTASGAQGDCLRIALSLNHRGREVLHEEWESEYELIDPPFPRPAPQAVVDAFVRARLDTVLARVRTQRLRASDLNEGTDWELYCGDAALNCVRAQLLTERARALAGSHTDSLAAITTRLEEAGSDTAEARAIIDDIRRSTRVGLHLAYGYETVMLLAYSPRARRFVPLFACC